MVQATEHRLTVHSPITSRPSSAWHGGVPAQRLVGSPGIVVVHELPQQANKMQFTERGHMVLALAVTEQVSDLRRVLVTKHFDRCSAVHSAVGYSVTLTCKILRDP